MLNELYVTYFRSRYKKMNKRTLIIKPATPKTFGNIAKVHSNHKAMISSRVLVKTLALDIKKEASRNHHDLTLLRRHGSNCLIFQQTNSISK